MNNLQVYIRHPDEIPIELEASSQQLTLNTGQQTLGLICHSDSMLNEGCPVELRVPHVEPSLRLAGRVNWCRAYGPGFELGINFDTPDTAMRMRMLEQLCQIHQYRLDIKKWEGRELSPEAAAQEWIERFAANFPVNGV